MNDYNDLFADALKKFWALRRSQANEQAARGSIDAGSRGAVTSGKHLGPVAALVAQVFADAGLPPGNNSTILPGYYRGTKDWDGVILHKGQIAAILEIKSQVGSFGNNQNNRIEEFIGQGRDINVAAESQLLGNIPPWFGYVMIIEDHETSRKQIAGHTKRSIMPVDDIFRSNPSYIERHAIAFNRMRLRGDISAACVVATNKDTGNFWYPDKTMSFGAFAAAVAGRVTEVLGALGS